MYYYASDQLYTITVKALLGMQCHILYVRMYIIRMCVQVCMINMNVPLNHINGCSIKIMVYVHK